MDDEPLTEDEIGQLMVSLIEMGAMEITGIHKDGQFIYRMTSKMEEAFPELYSQYISDSNEMLANLWKKGIVEVVVDDDGDFGVLPNENTFNYEDFDLTEEEIFMVQELLDWVDAQR